jgi:hypothetical protein
VVVGVVVAVDVGLVVVGLLVATVVEVVVVVVFVPQEASTKDSAIRDDKINQKSLFFIYPP